MTKRRHLVTIIKRSCLTGKVVWIYRGASRNAGRHAYWKACKKELEKVKQWAERMADRKRRLTLMLGSSDSNTSANGSSGNGSSGKASGKGSSANMFGGELTDEQRKAARELVRMSKQEPPPDMEFYNHIVEERRRRRQDKDIRRKMREREQQAAEGKDSTTGENKQNTDYDK